MEKPVGIYEPEAPQGRGRMPMWLIVLLVAIVTCAVVTLALTILPVLIIFVLALLGPAIGNVFSNIVLNI